MTTKALSVQLPEDVAANLEQSALEALAREALLIRLYDLGVVSSGSAAHALGISRREFLDLLGRYGVSAFDETVDLDREASRG